MLFSKVVTFEEKFRLICRAHSFQRLAEFRAEPRNLGFSAILSRGILFFRGFDVFHSNNYFFHRK